MDGTIFLRGESWFMAYAWHGLMGSATVGERVMNHFADPKATWDFSTLGFDSAWEGIERVEAKGKGIDTNGERPGMERQNTDVTIVETDSSSSSMVSIPRISIATSGLVLPNGGDIGSSGLEEKEGWIGAARETNEDELRRREAEEEEERERELMG